MGQPKLIKPVHHAVPTVTSENGEFDTKPSKPIPTTSGAKTSGIKIRGTGAATKGTMARGPMG